MRGRTAGFLSRFFVTFFVTFVTLCHVFVTLRHARGRVRRESPGRMSSLFLFPPLCDKILYEPRDKTVTKTPSRRLRQHGILSHCHATFSTHEISKPFFFPLLSKFRCGRILYGVRGKIMTETPLKGVFFLFKHIIHLLYKNKIFLSILSRIMYIPYFHDIVRMRARARARARETEVGR